MRFVLILLAACISALASPASARPWAAFHCGKTQIALIPEKYFNSENAACKQPCDGKEHYYDMKKDPKDEHPLPDRLFRMTNDGLFYKGKHCREFTGDEY
jgi:hypothetical protein